MYIGSNFHIQDFFKFIVAITVVVCKCLSTVDRLFAARKTMLEEELKVSWNILPQSLLDVQRHSYHVFQEVDQYIKYYKI